MIEGVPELSKKMNLSFGAVLTLVVFAFIIGFEAAAIYGLSEKLNDEVGGLRSDWDRDRMMQNERIQRLEQGHIK